MNLRALGILSLIVLLLLSMACHSGSPGAPGSPSTAGDGPDWSAPIWDESDWEGGEDAETTSTAALLKERRLPADHSQNWLQNHGPAALGGGQCASCHIEADCVSCHVESLARPYAVHPPNFTVIHALDARQNIQECTSCHRLDTFCQACHIETRFSPRLSDSPPSSVQFHPPGWLDAASPQNHGVLARQDINDCASCHVESDCIACHRGVNPHPPEFRFDCRRWLEANPAPCARCHIEVAPLADLCF